MTATIWVLMVLVAVAVLVTVLALRAGSRGVGTTEYGRRYLDWASEGYSLASDPRDRADVVTPSRLRRAARDRARGATGWVVRTLAGEWVAGCLARGCFWSETFIREGAAKSALTAHTATHRGNRQDREAGRDVSGRGAA